MKCLLPVLLCCLLAQPLLAQPVRLDSLQRRYATATHDSARSLLLVKLAYAYHYQHDRLDTALELANRGLALAEGIGFGRGILQNTYRLGSIRFAQGQEPEATRLFEASLRLAEQLADSTYLVNSLYGLGTLYDRAGNPPQARHTVERALALAQQMGDQSQASRCLTLLGAICFTAKDYAAAKQHYQAAYQLGRASQNWEIVGFALSDLAELALIEGQPAQALARYHQARALAQRSGDVPLKLHLLNSTGRAHTALGQLDSAIFYLNQVTAHRQSNNVLWLDAVANAYEKLGTAYEKKRDFAQAYQCLARHKALADSLAEVKNREKLLELQTWYDNDRQQAQISLLTKERQIGRQQNSLLAGAVVLLTALSAGIIGWGLWRHQQNRLRDEQNRKLQAQYEEIQAQRELIQAQAQKLLDLNTGLEAKIQERTQSLLHQNARLVEYAHINSHQLRAPVVSILGLVQLLNRTELAQNEAELIAYLRIEGQKLDEITRQIQQLIHSAEFGGAPEED
jgi:hypothetical protein